MEPSLHNLLHQLEQSLGYKPHTPRDFKRMGQTINDVTHESISVSTLRRLWGYDKAMGNPYTSTLDILARFLLYRDYDDFCLREASIGGVNLPHKNVSSRRTV